MGENIKIEVEGLHKLTLRFDNIDKEGRKRVARAINVNAMEFQREGRKQITKRTGRYRKYKRGRKTHYSSMPGAYPNSDTGNLRKNIRVTSRANMTRQAAEVLSGAKYSRALEEGHKNRGGGRTKARPFMSTMLRKKNKVFVARIKQAIRGVI